jgi:hypothetical protein
MLNPWYIEVRSKTRERIELNIVNDATGEIQRIELGVDDIANINRVHLDRITKIAELVYQDDETTLYELDNLIGYEEEE